MVQKSLEPIVATASQCIRGAIHFQFLSILEVTEPYNWLWWLFWCRRGDPMMRPTLSTESSESSSQGCPELLENRRTSLNYGRIHKPFAFHWSFSPLIRWIPNTESGALTSKWVGPQKMLFSLTPSCLLPDEPSLAEAN